MAGTDWLLRTLVCLIAALAAPAAAAEVTIAPLSGPSPKAPPLPDVEAELRAALAREVPATSGGVVEVRPAESEEILRQSFLNVVKGLPRYGGARDRIPAIMVDAGAVDLEMVAADPATGRLLECKAAVCTLRAPLYVGTGATLLIQGLGVRLEAEGGAFIASSGRLFIRNSTLEGVRSGKPAEFGARREFRPFLVAFDASETVILESRLRYLGFDEAHAYGLTLTTAAHDGAEGVPPTGIAAANEIEGLFYGFYSHGAADVKILGNIVRDSIRYGLDPHDASHRLVIGRNRVVGTRESHGIVASRRVAESWVVANVIEGNAGSGIVLDQQCVGILIAANQAINNGGDGIAIYESPGNIVSINTARSNQRAGLRVRNSVEIAVLGNEFRDNRDYGIAAYSGEPGGRRRAPRDDYEQRTTVVLAGNHLGGNQPADLQLKRIEELRIHSPLSADGSRPSVDGDTAWVAAFEGLTATSAVLSQAAP